MTKHATSLVNFATALALGFTASTGYPVAQTATPQTTDVKAPLTIGQRLKASIYAVAQDMERTALLPSANASASLSANVRTLQANINQYNQIKGQPAFIAPLAVDGKFGRETAEALINVAQREAIDEVLVNVPSLKLDDEVRMRFLRNKIEDIAPEAYIYAIRSYAEDRRENVAQSNLDHCLANSPKYSYKAPYLAEEAKKVRDDINYVTPLIPQLCMSALKELRVANRQYNQMNYLSSLFSHALKNDDYCIRKERSGAAIQRCVELNI